MSRTETIQKLRKARPAVLPSMLLCDFGNLEREIARLHEAGFQALHLDVMDGVFVPNFTYGVTIVEAIRKLTPLPLEVHLMMVRPEQYLEAFADAGANVLTFHAEAVEDRRSVLESIQKLDLVSGIAFNPATPVNDAKEWLDVCDVALIMSVNAGFGGQSFMPEVLPKLKQLRSFPGGQNVLLEIDGGVNTSTIASACQAGAELFVVGSAIFRQEDYGQAHRQLLDQLESAPDCTFTD